MKSLEAFTLVRVFVEGAATGVVELVGDVANKNKAILADELKKARAGADNAQGNLEKLLTAQEETKKV